MIQALNFVGFLLVCTGAGIEVWRILALHAGYASRVELELEEAVLPPADAEALKRVPAETGSLLTRWDEASGRLVFRRQFGPQNRYWGFAVGTVQPGASGAVLRWHPGFAFPSWLLAGAGLAGSLGLVFIEGERMGWLVFPTSLLGVVVYRFFQKLNARQLMVSAVVPELRASLGSP